MLCSWARPCEPRFYASQSSLSVGTSPLLVPPHLLVTLKTPPKAHTQHRMREIELESRVFDDVRLCYYYIYYRLLETKHLKPANHPHGRKGTELGLTTANPLLFIPFSLEVIARSSGTKRQTSFDALQSLRFRWHLVFFVMNLPNNNRGRSEPSILLYVLAAVLILDVARNLLIASPQYYGRVEWGEKGVGEQESQIPVLSTDVVDHQVRTQHPQNYRQMPGNKVFMTGPWVPEGIVASNLNMDPEFEYHLFNYSAMAASVKLIDEELKSKANITGAWESWKRLRPWAYRADLWRYMILWSEGGIYMDAKLQSIVSIRTWAALAENETLATCNDRGKWTSDRRGSIQNVWNAMLSAKKGSPFLLEAVRLIIRNVMHHSYGIVGEDSAMKRMGISADLCITGPCLLGYAASSFRINSTSDPYIESEVRLDCHFDGPESGIFNTEKSKLVNVDLKEHGRVRNGPEGNIYGQLWGRHRVYCDEPHDGGNDIACTKNWGNSTSEYFFDESRVKYRF
jgi:hypothetical protein